IGSAAGLGTRTVTVTNAAPGGGQATLGNAFTVTGPTSVEMLSAIPTEFALLQNYPNPFNPSTSIRFSLPEASNVRLALYNTLGVEVQVLVSEELTPGVYQYRLRAEELPSGMYIYSLRAQPNGGAKPYTNSKKLVLVK
ncbi:MAG TPA: T9SS type A sorting domain-containing protein, partial [Bacteroidota bacterium]